MEKETTIGELLFIKSVLIGARLSKKNPLYVTEAIDALGDRYGDTSFTETEERISKKIDEHLNK